MARTFVVGDVHGQAEALQRLLEGLRAPAAPGDTLVFVGDYVNRGPDSRGVLDLLLRVPEQWPGEVVCLKGNHEAALLEQLTDPDLRTFDRFLNSMGSRAMVANYCPEPCLHAFLAAFPPEHRQFLEALRAWYEDDRGIYVHAGVPPGRHPRQCPEAALYWMDYVWYQFPKPVVHGHKPQKKGVPTLTPSRIAIDTGAGHGGPLSAVALPDLEVFSVPTA